MKKSVTFDELFNGLNTGYSVYKIDNMRKKYINTSGPLAFIRSLGGVLRTAFMPGKVNGVRAWNYWNDDVLPSVNGAVTKCMDAIETDFNDKLEDKKEHVKESIDKLLGNIAETNIRIKERNKLIEKIARDEDSLEAEKKRLAEESEMLRALTDRLTEFK